ncbi:hypothetical protein BDV19DRAFT_362836 [Aspergillus venezuelensis]
MLNKLLNTLQLKRNIGRHGIVSFSIFFRGLLRCLPWLLLFSFLRFLTFFRRRFTL